MRGIICTLAGLQASVTFWMASLRMGVLNLLRLGTLKEDALSATFSGFAVPEAGPEDANLERPLRLCIRLGPGSVTAVSGLLWPDEAGVVGV